MCGALQSNVTLPDGSPYNYTVAQSSWQGGHGDVVDLYVKSSQEAGLPFGFYLTWVRLKLDKARGCHQQSLAPCSSELQLSFQLWSERLRPRTPPSGAGSRYEG